MSAHTPGPWMVGETLRADALAVIGDGDSVVCEFPDRLGASVDADARLIAAAPELLEACQTALGFMVAWSGFYQFYQSTLLLPDFHPMHSEDIDQVMAAIFKATGGAE